VGGFNPEFDDKKEKNTVNLGFKKVKEDGKSYRMLDLMLEPKNDYEIVEEKDKILLYKTESGRQKIYCWLFEGIDGRKGFGALKIAKVTGKGVYGGQEVILYNKSVIKLFTFLKNRLFLDLGNSKSFSLPYKKFEKLPEDFLNTLRNIQNFSKSDILELFSNIENIEDIAVISNLKKKEKSLEELKSIIDGNYVNEKGIEKFLERNIWILGNEFTFFVDDTQINKKNILDLLPTNFEGFLDIVELKLPKEKLFNFDESHENYYPTSKLTKTISQVQNYIYNIEMELKNKKITDSQKYNVFRPRGMIIFGSKKTLSEEETKYLRLLNYSYHNIKIFTYQQIYEKAKNILDLIKKREKVVK